MDQREVEGAVEKLQSVSRVDIDLWRKNMAALPKSVYTYVDEAELLSTALRDIGGR